jgi:hypothetical protein
VLGSIREALKSAGVGGADIAAIGITNQRETTLLWERSSGTPVHRSIRIFREPSSSGAVWRPATAWRSFPRSPGSAHLIGTLERAD